MGGINIDIQRSLSTLALLALLGLSPLSAETTDADAKSAEEKAAAFTETLSAEAEKAAAAQKEAAPEDAPKSAETTEAAPEGGKELPFTADKLTDGAAEVETDSPTVSGSTAAQDHVAQVHVQLPFGFTWGQNQEDVRYLLKGIGVRIISRQVVGPDREAWKLEGFIKPLLIGTTIYFTRGYMEEIEMQFGSETWQEADYTRLRRKLVQQFNQVYGPNRVLSNERSTADSVLQTLVGYQWQTQNTILRVFDFGASNGSERFRTVSVHYKYRDEMRMASRTAPEAK